MQNTIWHNLKVFVVTSTVYVFFASIGVVVGAIGTSVMGVFGLIYIAQTWGIAGTEMHLAALAILGMSFYLGIEIARDFTNQFRVRFFEGADIVSSMESIEPEEYDSDSTPVDVVALFIWVGGIVVASVLTGVVLIGTPLEAWSIPVALLIGVLEFVLASNEIPGPLLLLAISPLLVGYTFVGITRTVKDLLPQRIFRRHFPQFGGWG